MKRLLIGFFTFALGSVLLSASPFAGQDVKQKGTEKVSAPTEEKGLEHKSKYQREQQEGAPALQAAPEKEQKTAGKSEKDYWNPVGFQE